MLNFTRPGDPVDVVENTQGRPMSPHDEMRVVDEPGCEVPPGEEGELLVRGPYTLNGYYRAEEANARSFSPDGFYRTGDRVRIFADGPSGRLCRGDRAGSRTSSTAAARPCRRPISRTTCIPIPRSTRPPRSPCPTSIWARRSVPQSFSRAQPITLAELNAFLGRPRRVHACPARRARADAVAAHDRGGQGRQEAGRRATSASDLRCTASRRL